MSTAELEERIEELEAEIEDLEEIIEDFKADTRNITSIEAAKSSIVVNWVESGGIRVGLDSGGTAVQVQLSEAVYGWRIS